MKEKYATYSCLDFLTDDFFIESHLKKEDTTMAFWNEWRDAPAYVEAVELLLSIKSGLQSYQDNSISEEVKAYIFSKISETNQKQVLRVSFLKKSLYAGAAVLFLVAFGLMYLMKKDSVYSKNLELIEDKNIEQTNFDDKPKLIKLEDGSAVKLESKSKISYPEHFGKDNRIIILSGEAVFDIAKDPSRPFIVYANEVATKVLGTRFHVKAYDSMKDVVVSVQEGKVSVYKNKMEDNPGNELKGVILLPNQEAVFDRNSDLYDKKLIQKPNIIHPAEKINFVFDETPMAEVFEKIESAYGVEVEFNQEVLKDCQMTGTFENESLFQKLEIITKIIGGNYELVEGKIIINARGCNKF